MSDETLEQLAEEVVRERPSLQPSDPCSRCRHTHIADETGGECGVELITYLGDTPVQEFCNCPALEPSDTPQPQASQGVTEAEMRHGVGWPESLLTPKGGISPFEQWRQHWLTSSLVNLASPSRDGDLAAAFAAGAEWQGAQAHVSAGEMEARIGELEAALANVQEFMDALEQELIMALTYNWTRGKDGGVHPRIAKVRIRALLAPPKEAQE